jgi:heat shock protein HslJ
MSIRPKARAACAALACSTFLACGSRVADEALLFGHVWTLREMSGSRIPPGAEAGLFTAEFQADGQLSVRADCNRCSGRHEAAGGRMSISALACTRAFCAGTAPFDTDFVAQLGSAQGYDVGERRLTIRSERGRLVFDR